MPLDVKLMALATQLMLGLVALMCLGALGTWLLRHPVWTVKAIEVQGDVQHQPAAQARIEQQLPALRGALARG